MSVDTQQYLTMTLPYVCVENNVCLTHHAPTSAHNQIVKRIICEFRGTISIGLCFGFPRHEKNASSIKEGEKKNY